MAEYTGFGPRGINRVVTATQYVETIQRTRPIERSKYPIAAGIGLRPAISSGAITARSGQTPGVGNVYFETYHKNTNLYVVATNLIPVINPGNSSIDSGLWLWVANIDGVWQVVAADCNPS